MSSDASTGRTPQTSGEGRPPSLTVEGARATIHLQRPQRHNAIGIADIATFVELFERVERERAVRVLVLASSGPTFCAGYDLRALMSDRDAAPDAFGGMVDRLERLRVPTICALGGSVYGGGVDLALACDFRIGTPAIEVRMSAARLGVHYYASGLKRAVERLGVGGAKRLFLCADAVESEALARIGYLDEIVPEGALEQRVESLATTLARNGPAAVQGMKRALNAFARGDADLAEVERAWLTSFGSRELAEGMAAYAAKRDPEFEDP